VRATNQIRTDADIVVPFSDLAAMSADVRGALEFAWKEVTTGGSFIGGPQVEQFEDHRRVGSACRLTSG
jgi:hypothetical protein